MSNASFATEQIPDVLIYEMREFQIEQTPLENVISSTEFRNLHSDEDVFEMCSGSWRGYQAHWMLMRSKLYLNHIETKVCSTPQVIDTSKVLNKIGSTNEATWYSGDLTVRISEISQIENGIQFEALVFKILNGKLASRQIKTIERKW